jgi:hypothetical protein
MGRRIMPNKNIQPEVDWADYDLMSRMARETEKEIMEKRAMRQREMGPGIPDEYEAVHQGPLAQRAFDANQYRENLTRKLMKQGRAQDQIAAGMLNMDPRNTLTWRGLSAGADALGRAGKTIFDHAIPAGGRIRRGGEKILEEYGPKLQQAILALMEIIQSGQEDFGKEYQKRGGKGMRLR